MSRKRNKLEKGAVVSAQNVQLKVNATGVPMAVAKALVTEIAKTVNGKRGSFTGSFTHKRGGNHEDSVSVQKGGESGVIAHFSVQAGGRENSFSGSLTGPEELIALFGSNGVVPNESKRGEEGDFVPPSDDPIGLNSSVHDNKKDSAVKVCADPDTLKTLLELLKERFPKGCRASWKNIRGVIQELGAYNNIRGAGRGLGCLVRHGYVALVPNTNEGIHGMYEVVYSPKEVAEKEQPTTEETVTSASNLATSGSTHFDVRSFVTQVVAEKKELVGLKEKETVLVAELDQVRKRIEAIEGSLRSLDEFRKVLNEMNG